MPHGVELAMRAVGALQQVHGRLGRTDRRRLTMLSRDLSTQTQCSVVMPVYNPPRKWLKRAIESVRAQVYSGWELCIADDASDETPWLQGYLAALAAKDRRIKFVRREVNGHISAASNSALELATGDYIALLDQDDELSPLALLHVALHLATRPDDLVVYSDEDAINAWGVRYGGHRKLPFNEDLLKSYNYINHLGVYRRTEVVRLGGFRSAFDGSQDHDLALRMTAIDPMRVGHIPHVLYHWRSLASSVSGNAEAKPYTVDAGVQAINQSLSGVGTAEPRGVGKAFRGYRVVPPRWTGTSDVVLVRDGQLAEASKEAMTSQADAVVFLAAGAELPDPAQLDALLGHLLREGVGAVGGSITSPEHLLVDGALWIGQRAEGLAPAVQPIYSGFKADSGGLSARAELAQRVSALSLNFMALSRDSLHQFRLNTQTFPHYADVDLCMRLMLAGQRCLWVPEISAVGRSALTRPAGAELNELARVHNGLRQRERNAIPEALLDLPYRHKRFNDALGIRSALQASSILASRDDASRGLR